MYKPEPPPLDSNYPIIHEQLIKLIQDRLEFGIQKYGKPLRAFDGRRSLFDALDELIDGAVYTLKEIEERQVLDAQIEKLKSRIKELEKLINEAKSDSNEL